MMVTVDSEDLITILDRLTIHDDDRFDAVKRVRSAITEAEKRKAEHENFRIRKDERKALQAKARGLLTKARNVVVKAGIEYNTNDAMWGARRPQVSGGLNSDGSAYLKCYFGQDPDKIIIALNDVGIKAHISPNDKRYVRILPEEEVE